MDPTTTATDPISRPKPNGILTRKHNQQPMMKHHPQPHTSPPPSLLYRECLKNHAASLGGHALDGCGEFMPSPSSNPSDPSSLTCAACGCHRNFHRRASPYDYDMEDSGGGGASSQNDDTDDGGGAEVDRRHHSTSPPPPSAPHMLLALSTGAAAGPAAGGGATAATATATVGVGGILPRKRFRSKFSPEQKERMQELSERLGWRMQKHDEGIVEETCRDIGVGKGVFKVWMHNNKHNFVLKTATTNASGSSANVTATAAADLGLGGDSLVLHHHHHHHHNGVNGSADSSF